MLTPGLKRFLRRLYPWQVSRRDTTYVKVRYLAGQIPLWWMAKSRRWAVQRMAIRVVDNNRGGAYNATDVRLYSDIVRRRHYLRRWPVPPNKKILVYLADIDGLQPGPAGVAGMMMFSLIPSNHIVVEALRARGADLHQCEVLTLVRCWRADDLTPDVAPNFTPQFLRRVIRGHAVQALPSLRDVWVARKCNERLEAQPRLLVTYADPAQGHDGALYRAADAVFCGTAKDGKLLFAWALEDGLRDDLMACAVKEIAVE